MDEYGFRVCLYILRVSTNNPFRKLLLSEFVLDCLLVTLIKLCNLCDDSLFDGQLDVIFKV